MERMVITARQLARDGSAVLDTLLREEVVITITRRGRPVAELRPLRLTPWAPTNTDFACGATLPEVDVESLDLDERQRVILTTCRDGFHPDEASAALPDVGNGQVALAVTYLEIKGLTRKTHSGYTFTDLGRATAQVLKSEAETAPKDDV